VFKKNKIKNPVFFFFILLFFFLIPLISQAQTSIGSHIYLTTTPEVPVAGKLITISLSYPLSDLTRARISWYVNNTLQSQGVGKTKIDVPMGKVGERTSVQVSITTQEGKFLTQTIALTPSSVYILWETDTYTPSLYKGKALPTQGSTLRLTAVPTFIKNGVEINPKDLYYTWSIGGVSKGDAIKGGQVIEVPFDKKSTKTSISVSVANANKTVISKENITITAAKPDVVFYENNSVSGILYNKAIPSVFTSPKKTFSFIAEPFYVPSSVFLAGEYNWKINGKIAQSSDNSVRALTVSPEGSLIGAVNTIEWSITNRALFGGVLKKILSLTL